MPPELRQNEVEAQPQNEEPSAEAATPEPAVETTAVSSDAPKQDESVRQVPVSKFKEIKAKAQERGRKAANEELSSRLQEAGFESLDALLTTVNSLKEAQTKTPEPEPEKKQMATKRRTGKGRTNKSATKENRMTKSRDTREVARLAAANAKATEKYRREERKRKAAERALRAKEAEMELQRTAIEAGVTDVDYAIRLMTKELEGKSKDELAAFDEKAFFATTLREKKPYLYNEKVTPATTGTGAGGEDTPPEPGPGEVATTTAEAQHFDARKASREDYEARLKELGLNPNQALPAT